MIAVLRIKDAAVTEAAVLGDLQRRSSNIWEAYREQLAANPDANEIPQTFLVNGWVRVAGDDKRAPIGFSVVIPTTGGSYELDGLFVDPAHIADARRAFQATAPIAASA